MTPEPTEGLGLKRLSKNKRMVHPPASLMKNIHEYHHAKLKNATLFHNSFSPNTNMLSQTSNSHSFSLFVHFSHFQFPRFLLLSPFPTRYSPTCTYPGQHDFFEANKAKRSGWKTGLLSNRSLLLLKPVSRLKSWYRVGIKLSGKCTYAPLHRLSLCLLHPLSPFSLSHVP